MQRLPKEVWEEILVRLQVVDLLRFKSVCKRWYLIISSAYFKQMHLKKSTACPSHHRILIPHNKKLMKTIDCSDLYGELVINSLPTPCNSEVTYLGTCNGLVCFYNQKNKYIWVGNPAMRVSKRLKKTTLSADDMRFYWFGHYDDEYKLVMGGDDKKFKNRIRLIRPYAADDESDWESTHEIDKNYICVEGGTLFNGRVHWPAYDLFGNVGAFVVLSFDLRNQSVAEITPHEGMLGLMREYVAVCVMDGCLSAIHRKMEHHKPVFEVWIMSEYGVKESWKKLAVLSGIDVPHCLDYPFLFLVGITHKGDLILTVENTKLLVYNIAQNKSKILMSKTRRRTVMYVVESLLSPNSANGI